MLVEVWIKGFMAWSKKNPMMAGVLTFIPVMTIAAVVKITRGVGKGLGFVEKGFARPGKVGGGRKDLQGEGERGWVLENSKGFGKSERGPFEGLLKMLQRLV